MPTATTTKHGLAAEGFRFVLRNGDMNWRHPLEMAEGDVDVSDLDDDEFYALVVKLEAEKKAVQQ